MSGVGKLTHYLAPLERVLDSCENTVEFFFRDDDAGWADPELFALCDRFATRCALDLAVIPVQTSSFLANELISHDAELGFHQHGFAHLNHQTSGRKCEFGDERTYMAISNDVAAGRALLLDLFGSRLDPIFTPPWNRCSSATAEAAMAAGLGCLSRDLGAKPIETFGLTELPVSVDWVKNRPTLGSQLAKAATGRSPVGVMLHHEMLDATDLTMIDALIDLLVQHPVSVVRSMGELSQDLAAADLVRSEVVS